MLARLGWIGTALAAGLLLQIVVQINVLHWLPDFPVYLALALLAAVAALLSAPLLMLRKGLPPKNRSWRKTLAIAGLVPLAMCIHGLLAAKSSSSAIEWWRDVALWPALLVGAAACVLTGPGWKSLSFLWPLGEAAAAILACWYAPSFGESSSWRAYQYVLAAALITAASLLPLVLLEPRWRRRWSVWLLLTATLALPLICLIQTNTEAGQPWMLGLAVVRFGVLAVAVDRWLKDVVEAELPLR